MLIIAPILLAFYCIFHSTVNATLAALVVHPLAAVVVRSTSCWPAGIFIESEPLSVSAAVDNVMLPRIVVVLLLNIETDGKIAHPAGCVFATDCRRVMVMGCSVRNKGAKVVILLMEVANCPFAILGALLIAVSPLIATDPAVTEPVAFTLPETLNVPVTLVPESGDIWPRFDGA